jgi:DNA-binding GntR family transcriptional regulator
VRTVDDDFVRNIFEIREAIEPIFTRRFCLRATPRDLERLRAAAAAFEALASERPTDFEALDAANRNFHDLIVEGEVNIQAIEVMERYAGLINATRAKLPLTMARLRQRIAQHGQIVEAVAAGDVNAAVRAAVEHVRGAAEDMLNLMRQARMTSARAAKEPEIVTQGIKGLSASP